MTKIIQSPYIEKFVYICTFLIFVLHNCSPCPSIDNTTKKHYSEKIYDWQFRESQCINSYEFFYSTLTPDWDTVINIHNFVFFLLEQVSDDHKNDYWQTSCETLKREKGDCEDFSILLAMELRAIGFGDDNIWVGVIEREIGFDHAFVIIKILNDEYVLDANKGLVDEILLLDDYLQLTNSRLICKFNLFSISFF